MRALLCVCVFLSVFVGSSLARADALETALRREVALLEAEQRALEESAASVAAARAARTAELAKSIAALEVALGFDALEELDIVVRDLEQGLIDFPTMINGEEVYLCWLLDEPEVVYWHAPESGFGGRHPL